MSFFEVIAVVLCLTAFFVYLNERFLRLPATIGFVVIALAFSLSLALLHTLGVNVPYAGDVAFLSRLNFSKTLLHGMLCFLLFAGALHVPLDSMKRERYTILMLAVIATILATVITGTLCRLILGCFGIHVPYVFTLMFGAIISPTDPIAALAILSRLGLPKRLESIIDGESLFNDGVGVVLFVMLSGIAFKGEELSALHAIALFAREVAGGILLGFALGYLACALLRGMSKNASRLLITLAVVTGGYALAEHLMLSGPIAMVITGLFVGNFRKTRTMTPQARELLNLFWNFVDEIFNAVLFCLLGLQILVIHWRFELLWMGLVAILASLSGRWLSVGGSIALLNVAKKFDARRIQLVNLLTWSGLRGGLSVAMVMSLPDDNAYYVPLFMMTYSVMMFSLIIQGLTIDKLFSSAEMEQIARVV